MSRPPTAKDDCGACKADALSVKGYRGVAFYGVGHPITTREVWVDDEDAPQGGYADTEDVVETGQFVAVMVGDDRRHIVDVDDCAPMAREAYCGECGQIGCTHDGLVREEGVLA